jgi:hypothetical protein
MIAPATPTSRAEAIPSGTDEMAPGTPAIASARRSARRGATDAMNRRTPASSTGPKLRDDGRYVEMMLAPETPGAP